jgi:hypothetical protein
MKAPSNVSRKEKLNTHKLYVQRISYLTLVIFETMKRSKFLQCHIIVENC